MLDELTQRIVAFRDERDWQQFHSARNLATSVVIESAELLELFQWENDSNAPEGLAAKHEDLKREMADVLIYLLLLANELDIDLEAAALAKIEENEAKYPADKARGSSRKYTEL